MTLEWDFSTIIHKRVSKHSYNWNISIIFKMAQAAFLNVWHQKYIDSFTKDTELFFLKVCAYKRQMNH